MNRSPSARYPAIVIHLSLSLGTLFGNTVLAQQARFTGLRPHLGTPPTIRPVEALSPSDKPVEPDSTQPPTERVGSVPLEPLGESPPSPTLLQEVGKDQVQLQDLVIHSLRFKSILNSLSSQVVIETASDYDIGIARSNILGAESRFDPNWTAYLAGNDVNRPDNSFFGPGLQQANRRDEGEFQWQVSKLFPTGLSASVGYEPSLAYLFFPGGNSSGFNPTHSSDLVLRLNRPLLRGAGKEINLATIRIAENLARQSVWDVMSSVQAQIRSIETVYWRLHAEHVRLRAIDEAIELAQSTLEIAKVRYEGERAIYTDVARAQVKLEDLYQQRLQAELAILRSSFDLAQLSGLEIVDQRVLVPANSPELRPPKFDSQIIVQTAMGMNPRLQQMREALEIRRNFVGLARNQRKPDLSLQASHRTSGLADDLGSSLQQMFGYEFNDFTLGLRYSQQFGARRAKSQIQAAELEQMREVAIIEATERQIRFDLLQLLNELEQQYANYESALRQLAQAQRWLELARLRYDDPPLNEANQRSFLISLLDYQTALQAKVDAIVLVADTVATYNSTLAILDEKRGTILDRWQIGMPTTRTPSEHIDTAE